MTKIKELKTVGNFDAWLKILSVSLDSTLAYSNISIRWKNKDIIFKLSSYEFELLKQKIEIAGYDNDDMLIKEINEYLI